MRTPSCSDFNNLQSTAVVSGVSDVQFELVGGGGLPKDYSGRIVLSETSVGKKKFFSNRNFPLRSILLRGLFKLF